MLKSMVVAVIGSALISSFAAERAPSEFPLRYRPLQAQEAMEFPGGYGLSIALRTTRPDALKKEPAAISAKTFYGWLGESNRGCLLRLDESRGTGKGYDQLLVDVNRNLDLTDDAPVKVARATNRTTSSRQILFGPIQAPANKQTPGIVPRYFAEVTVYNYSSSALLRTVRTPSARLRVKPGWLLETAVSIPGFRQNLGLIDSDCNQRLGDPWKVRPIKYSREQETENWSITIGDTVLMDTDASGNFINQIYGSRNVSLSSMVYLGNDPYRLVIAPDCKSLRVEPWPEPTMLVNLKPRGLDVTGLTLLWQAPDQQWQMIKPGVINGHLKLPPGQYHLYSSTLSALAGTREQVSLMGFKRTVTPPLVFERGKQNSLLCGAPMEIKVTTTKPAATRTGLLSGIYEPVAASDTSVRISASAIGAGGETYSSFAKGLDFKDKPDKPVFLITDTRGRQLATGNLEFG